MTKQDAQARVAKGAAHLDKMRPGWERRIDVQTLTMWDPCGCIIGQLVGCQFGCQFFRAARSLFIDDVVAYGFERDAVPYMNSFTNSGNEGQRRYALLQDAWIEAIADRLHPDKNEGRNNGVEDVGDLRPVLREAIPR